MKVLIIAAHGSRKKESNIEVEKLADRLARKVDGRFDKVIHAFLQMADPLLETSLTQCVKNGATHVVIFPFFIGSGSHILEDIPSLVEKAQQANPHVEFKLTRHLGSIEAIEAVIINEVTS
ncbi:MAG: CbiX/SirB N-terminal domain-containing protein [Pseudomonadota bacterium]